MKFYPDLSGSRCSAGVRALIVIIIFLAICALSFFLNAGILWLICWAFHGSWWSWRVCIGFWLLEFVLSGVFGGTGGKS